MAPSPLPQFSLGSIGRMSCMGSHFSHTAPHFTLTTNGSGGLPGGAWHIFGGVGGRCCICVFLSPPHLHDEGACLVVYLCPTPPPASYSDFRGGVCLGVLLLTPPLHTSPSAYFDVRGGGGAASLQDCLFLLISSFMYSVIHVRKRSTA